MYCYYCSQKKYLFLSRRNCNWKFLPESLGPYLITRCISDQGRPSPPSTPGGNLPPTLTPSPSLLPLIVSFFLLSPVSLPFPLFFSGVVRNVYFDLASFPLFSPFPFVPLVFLLFFLSLPMFSFFPSLFFRSKTPEMQLEGLGERCDLPQPEIESGAF